MAATITQHVASAEHFSISTISSIQKRATSEGVTSKTEYSPRNVVATLNYYKDNEDGSPPAPNYVNKPESYKRPVSAERVTIHDIRGSEDQYTLDTVGFQIVKHQSEEHDFTDSDKIKNLYYPEIETLLKNVTGASRVEIFDHVVRRSPTFAPRSSPVYNVHVDQSYNAAVKRVSQILPDEAESRLHDRYQIINVWRPIKTIFRDPLALADANTVADSDLVSIKFIAPDKETETVSVRPRNEHKWYYLNEQTPEEVLLIKCYDSKTDGRARRVPHSAFSDTERASYPPRESIEIRALVFGGE